MESKQLSQSKDEIELLKKQLSDEQAAHKSEIQTLTKEATDLRHQLSQASQESLLKSTEQIKERRKVEIRSPRFSE
jgi:hypothetical protein